MNYYSHFETKNSLNNIPYKKLSMNCKQHSKIRKEHALIKYVFWEGSTISFILVKPLLHQKRSEAVVRRCFTKYMFLEILQNPQENTCVGDTF